MSLILLHIKINNIYCVQVLYIICAEYSSIYDDNKWEIIIFFNLYQIYLTNVEIYNILSLTTYLAIQCFHYHNLSLPTR